MTEELISLATAKLAKAKGFDEVCANVWHYWGETWHEGVDIFSYSPVKPLPLEIRAMYDDLMQYYPTKNSTLPAHIIARPTQDLLEKWLRETHGIHVFVKLIRGEKELTHPVYVPGDYNGLYDNSEKWENIKGYNNHSDAREYALQHALTLVP